MHWFLFAVLLTCLPVMGNCGANNPEHFDDAGIYVGPQCEKEE